MRSSKATHIKAVAALLQEGAESPEDLAKLVIAKVDELREPDTTYAVVVQVGSSHNGPFVAYGPFPTPNRAHHAIGKGHLGGGLVGVRTIRGVIPVYTPEHYAKTQDELDEPVKTKGDFKDIAEDAKAFKQARQRSAAQ